MVIFFCAATSLQRGQLGVHKTATTASGTGHIFCAATSLQHGQSGVHKTVTTASGIVQLPPSNAAKLATLEEGSCIKI